MADEIKLTMELTLKEAALIKFIRDAGPYSDIKVIKRNESIERIIKEESRKMKDLTLDYGLSIKEKNPQLDMSEPTLDNGIDNEL